VKRAIDVVVAVGTLLVLSPLLAVVAVAIRVTMGGPVLFRQARAGRRARPFDLLKFRTMRLEAAGEHGPRHDMDRVTKLGAFLRRTSIDELPSLANVLRGELTLVGPRPLPVNYVDRYSEEQARRLLVTPGLTGWAVVHGRNQLNWEERFELDVWYVDHRSMLLDLKIILRTVGLVLRGSGVNQSDRVTMTEFGAGRS
jgi:sugar transferase EpsL